MPQLPFLEQLEKHNNELEVRENIAHGTYNAQTLAIAQEWLRRKEATRASLASGKAQALEEEGLRVAKEANDIARSASFAATATAAASAASEANTLARRSNRIAIAAMIMAAIAAIAAIVAAYAAIKGIK